MRWTRTVELCLLATLALNAAAAAPAPAALPEFSGPFPKAFTSSSKGSILQTVSAVKVKCKADVTAGEISAEKAGNINITFTGCEAAGSACESPGAAPGEIATFTLGVTLGYLNREAKEVGFDLAAIAPAPIAMFACGSLEGSVVGSAIGRINPVNKVKRPTSRFTLRFSQSGGKQRAIKLEGEPKEVLETSLAGGLYEESGLTSTDAIRFSEAVEISA